MKPPLQRIEEFLENPERGEYSIVAIAHICKLEAALREAAKDLKTLKAVGTLERIADILDGGEK